MRTAGVRGATTVSRDDKDEILAATTELLEAILAANPQMQTQDLSSAFFTLTDDLSAVHPAKAARLMGWTEVPLMCAQEIPVPGSLPRCIRVLLHWNTELKQNEVHHIYLRDAVQLRPDLTSTPTNKEVSK